MILVDTSIWINHLRKKNSAFSEMLVDGQVACHPFVIGELSCGNLKNREEVLDLLSNLPLTTIAEHEEVLELIRVKKLMGQGIGWVDAHLLASALISGTPLWTVDRRLRAISAALGVLFS